MTRSSVPWAKAFILVMASMILAACGVFNTGASSPEIVLNVTSFERVDCEEAEHCYEFKASTDGQGTGQGSCRVVAIGDQREELWVEMRFHNLELEMGKEFEWTIPVQEPDDDRFAEWKAECEPQGEG